MRSHCRASCPPLLLLWLIIALVVACQVEAFPWVDAYQEVPCQEVPEAASQEASSQEASSLGVPCQVGVHQASQGEALLHLEEPYLEVPHARTPLELQTSEAASSPEQDPQRHAQDQTGQPVGHQMVLLVDHARQHDPPQVHLPQNPRGESPSPLVGDPRQIGTQHSRREVAPSRAFASPLAPPLLYPSSQGSCDTPRSPRARCSCAGRTT